VTNQVAEGALRRPANRRCASRWSVLRREIALRAAPVEIQGPVCLFDVPTSCGRTCGSEGPVASFPVPLPGIYEDHACELSRISRRLRSGNPPSSRHFSE
jgi:hypothetical protein